MKKLAQDAVGIQGYIIQVKGFADSSGNAAMNQKLSMERAQNVIAYLIQDCNVPVRHGMAPGAMGETAAVASNETKSRRAVEVTVLVNRHRRQLNSGLDHLTQGTASCRTAVNLDALKSR